MRSMKCQFICVTTFTFDFLTAELIDEARMKNNKSFIVMTFHDKSKLMSLSLQCLHCKKTNYEKPMCFVKYPHKKKKLDAAWAAKKKDKLSSSDKFLKNSFDQKCCRMSVHSVEIVTSIIQTITKKIADRASWNLYLYQREFDEKYSLTLW